MYRNPKSTKQEIKLFLFYLLDLGIVAGMVFVGHYLGEVLALPVVMIILNYLLWACFGIFLCVRTPSHPIDRNMSVLMYMLRMDRNKYFPIEVRKDEFAREDSK